MKSTTPKPSVFLVAAVTDNPDAWNMTATKESKGIIFSAGIGDEKLSKQDIKFINAHLKRFLQLHDTLKGGEPVDSDN